MKFFEGKPGRTLLCRLDYEADLLGSLKKLAGEKRIEAAVFFMLGAVKKAAFCFYDQEGKRYTENIVLDKSLEVLSCIGNIAKHKGEVAVHAHIVVSDDAGRCYGGHLVQGTTIFSGEVYLVELLGVELEREYDPVTGLNLLR